GVVTAPSRLELVLRRPVAALVVIGVACILYGRLVEPWWPAFEHVRIASAKWPAASPPLRIVHLSDLHCEREPRLEERLPDLVAAARPDVIVFTGDSLNEPAGLPVLRRLLTRLATVAPVVVVKGNWDVWYWSDLDLFGGTGVHELDAQTKTLTVRGVDVQLVGAPVGKADQGIEALRAASPDALRVFLYHYPDEIYRAAGAGADLYLAGHTHGGQVALPFYGALVTFSRFGKRFESGLYAVPPTHLYVNRGIGMEGGSAPRVRFWARPEITVLEVGGPGGR
ncbi:MAG: hypothetical protein EOO75_17180, partial [Myxococcales bacterium]